MNYIASFLDLFLQEDDVEPVRPGFVRAALSFVDRVERRQRRRKQGPGGPSWSSLSLSPSHLSIGRLYRTETLPKLVAFVLAAYASQPVDFLMHYFDAMVLADGFKSVGVTRK